MQHFFRAYKSYRTKIWELTLSGQSNFSQKNMLHLFGKITLKRQNDSSKHIRLKKLLNKKYLLNYWPKLLVLDILKVGIAFGETSAYCLMDYSSILSLSVL